MKTKSIWLLALLIMSVVGCKYDDDALWEKVNSLDERMASIEEKLKTVNSDISSISTVINALQKNVYVASVESVNDGYIIKFTDGTKATISNGKAGANGKDASIIGVDVFEGKYYWTQTINGTKSWLTGAGGKKIPVTGADAVTPQLKTDVNGYWLISYDKGATFSKVLDGAGNPVMAIGKDGIDGEDGIDGTNGSDGISGDSFFQSVTVEGNELVLVLADGTNLRIPISANTHP